MSSDWTQGCSRFQFLPSCTHCHTQVHSSIPDRGHTVTGPQTAPTVPATPAHLTPPLALSGLVHSGQPSRGLTEQLLGEIPTPASASTCPLPRCGSATSPLLLSLRKIVHQGLFVSITVGQCRVSFSSLFLLLPRTKSLSHPSVSWLGTEASRYSCRCKEKCQRETLLQS